RFDEARPLWTETMAQMNERGMRLQLAAMMEVVWITEMLAGDHAAAERAARHGCEQLDRLGHRGTLSTHACALAEPLCALGRYEDSEQCGFRRLELRTRDDLL